MTSRARLLALRPPRPPREELAPVSLGSRGGWPYERRLEAMLKRAWDGGVEEAIRGAAAEIGLSVDATDRLVGKIAAHLFESHSVEIRADQADKVDEHWRAVEHKLVSIMTEEGLDLDLACARIGLDINKLKVRVTDTDPMLGARLEIAFLRGTAKLHGMVWKAAKEGKERSALALLQARDPRYVPTVKVEITEQQILSSGAFQSVLRRLLDGLSVQAPEGAAEEYRRAWLDALSAARAKVAEELGNG